MRAARLLLIAAGLLSAPALAGPYEDGLAAYERADYTAALRLYKTAADRGHAYADIQLGLMYSFGKGVTRNAAEAVRLYRLAAEQGEAHAFSLLGVSYEYGQGIESDLRRAYMWFSLAEVKEPSRSGDRERVEGKLTFPQVAAAKEMAAACTAAKFKDC